MATGFRNFNTVVSGSSAQAGLTGDDVRALEFDAALKMVAPITLSTTLGANTMSAANWVQASIGTLLLNASTGPTLISVGPDAESQAAAYINLFDIKSTSERRLLRFGLSAFGGTNCTVNLYNTSTGPQTNTFVQLNVQGLTGPAAQQILFAATGSSSASGFAVPYAGGAGMERLVILRAVNIDVGSQSVDFNVLPFSI